MEVEERFNLLKNEISFFEAFSSRLSYSIYSTLCRKISNHIFFIQMSSFDDKMGLDQRERRDLQIYATKQVGMFIGVSPLLATCFPIFSVFALWFDFDLPVQVIFGLSILSIPLTIYISDKSYNSIVAMIIRDSCDGPKFINPETGESKRAIINRKNRT